MNIRTLSLSGTSEEIGLEHGRQLAGSIHTNIEFYKSLFLSTIRSEPEILIAAEKFKANIQAYDFDLANEIDHIAKGAALSEPLWLYAINARTELSMLKVNNECTALVCPQSNLLAQTWDWSERLEDNFVLMEISFPDGHKILQLTEAGIIGKIGMNSRGLGVTLNYLYDEHVELTTVPIHILLRRVLQCHNLKEAKEEAQRSGIGKASNLIIAQSNQAVNIEFAGDRVKFHDILQTAYVHTNHYIHAKPPNITDPESFENSTTRFLRAKEMLQSIPSYDSQRIIEILTDQTNGKKSILAKYKPDPLDMLGDYGTLATIVMDLDERSMLLRLGNPNNPGFSLDAFEIYELK